MIVLPAMPPEQTASWLGLRDFVILAGLLTARDFRGEELTKKDRQRLRAMVAAVKKDRVLLIEVPNAEVSLERLGMAADL